MINIKNKVKPFNLKFSQEFMPPVDTMRPNEQPEMTGDEIQQTDEIQQIDEVNKQEEFSFLDGSDLKDWLDQKDFLIAREELLHYVENRDTQQVIEDALNSYYETSPDSNSRLSLSVGIFNLLPDSLKVPDINDETIIQAPYIKSMIEETNKEIKKIAEKHVKKVYNFMKKTAQHKSFENTIMYGPQGTRIDPFYRMPVSDWHIVERNKGWGGDIGGIWNIDYETLWRENIMDKYSRPYKDKDGNWVGGYLNKRFEIDYDIPETSNMQLKPGQLRKPILTEYGNTESRLETAREKGEIKGGPVVEGKPFNWKKAQSKKKR